MYKIIDEKLGLASCSLSDLTMQQVTKFLGQWEDDAPIGSLTLFYDSEKDLVVLNRDNQDFDIYFGLAKAVLKADTQEGQELGEKVPSSCCETVQVLRNAAQARKINEELRINGEQRIDWQEGTYLCAVFKAMMRKYGGWKNPLFLMSQAYSYGAIQGKREERARRKE